MNNLPFSLLQLQEMLDLKYVQMTRHPEFPIYIYNYTAKAQYDGVWNNVTKHCRGLILDDAYNIVARPFAKFFNIGELADQPLPSQSFEVFDKLDGSLGILYWWNDRPFIATRGSFMSEQSIKASELLMSKYNSSIQHLDRDLTYLFEIIYPENRIVLDYGTKTELVILATIDMETGMDIPIPNIGFPIAKRYDGLSDIEKIKELQLDDLEGFVIKYASGYRLKVKFSEYVRLHRIITQVSSKTIWEHLSTGIGINNLLENVPDEFYDWVRKTVDELNTEYIKIESEARSQYKELEDRKTTALYYLTCKYPTILFKMLENKSYDTIIWKMLKPKYERPFKKNIEE